MKAILTNDTILSLENVRRVEKSVSTSKRENHVIRVHYTDDKREVLYYDSEIEMLKTFSEIYTILTKENA